MKERIHISRITQDLKNAIKDCLLSLFYRKADIIPFLKECGSTARDMQGINESLTKSQIVDIYFSNIGARADEGTMQYHALIRNLIDWSDFDSYWFQNKKLDSSYAKGRVEKLQELLGKKTEKEEEKSRKKEREAEAEKIKAKNRTMEDLRVEFYEMCKNKDSSQKRGFALEAFLQKLFGIFEIDVFKSFKLLGEQIDGAIKFDSANYTSEAKWHDTEIACNSLYDFAYKIESNTLYPRGLFFSINGYSEESIQRITHGKSPQLLLFDAVDFVNILEERITMHKLLEEKIRYAQTRSRIYVNANEIINSL